LLTSFRPASRSVDGWCVFRTEGSAAQRPGLQAWFTWQSNRCGLKGRPRHCYPKTRATFQAAFLIGPAYPGLEAPGFVLSGLQPGGC